MKMRRGALSAPISWFKLRVGATDPYGKYMDNRALAKKFHDKKFLKSNDFVTFTSKFVDFLSDNKGLVGAAVIVLIVLGFSIPGLKWYRLRQINSFNEKLYGAQKSLKKESLYSELITDYQSLPASQLARLKLVDELVDHDKKEAAQQVIAEGLLADKRDIFTTLLVLKNLGLLKADKKYSDAIAYARQSSCGAQERHPPGLRR